MIDENVEPTPDPGAGGEGASRGDHADGAASPDALGASIAATGFRAGMVLGDYRLEALIGRGGMGQVWRARQASLDRLVALKLLPFGHALGEEQLVLFEREARAGGRLQHPSIVAVYAYGEVDGVPFIAQEIVGDGTTLASRLAAMRREGELPSGWFGDVARFFATAAEALAAVHEAGVIHRDLKPANILIAPDFTPKIADFGLAKVIDAESVSRAGDLAGTYAYMSPEQVMAKRIGIDARTDVFSLGSTLYEALTLTRAFDGDTAQQITEKIVYHDPPDPRVVRSKVPGDLAVICCKAMEKRRDDRYASMAEFGADLRRWLGHRPIVARPPSPLARARRWTRRHPIVTSTVAVLALALVVVSGLLLEIASLDRARLGALEEVRWQASVANLRAANVNLAHRRRADALTALDRVAEEHRGWEWAWMVALADAAAASYDGWSGPFTALEVSPGGGLLACSPADEGLAFAAHDLDTLAPVHVATADGTGSARAFSFSSDGARLAVAFEKGPVRVYDTASWRIEREWGAFGETAWDVHLASDGRTLLAAGDGRTSRVLRWDLDEPDGTGALVPFKEIRELRRTDAETEALVLEAVEQIQGAEDDTESGVGEDLAAKLASRLLGQMVFDAHRLSVVDGAPGPLVVLAERNDFIFETTEAALYDVERRAVIERVKLGAGDAVGVIYGDDGEAAVVVVGHYGLATIHGETIRSLSGEPFTFPLEHDRPSASAWDPSSYRIATGADDGSVVLSHVSPMLSIPPEPFLGHEARVDVVAFSGDGLAMVSGDADGALRRWRSGRGGALYRRDVRMLEKNPDRVRFAGDVLLLVDGDELITYDADSLEEVWRTSVTAELVELRLLADGRRLVTLTAHELAVWEPPAPAPLARRTDSTAAFTALAVRASDGLVGVGTDDGRVSLWDGAGGRAQRELSVGEAAIARVAFAEAGGALVAVDVDGAVSVVRDGAVVDTTEARAALAEHGRTFDVAALDGGAHLVALVRTPEGATSLVSCDATGVTDALDLTGAQAVRAGPGPSRVAVAFVDGFVRVFDAATLEPVFEWPLLAGTFESFEVTAEPVRITATTPETLALLQVP